MSNYKRVTRECALEQLRPELLQPIREYLQGHKLTEVEAQILMCCETLSERQKTSGIAALLGDAPDKLYYTGILVTPDWLIWVHSGAKAGSAVVSAQLKEIHVKPFASLLVKDAGLEVFGYVGEARTHVRGYIGLGSEPAAQKFCETVRQAVDKVNPPRNLLDAFTSKRK